MPTSATVTESRRNGRLGVNPRRAHVKEGERKRVKTACNSCNVRRVRCTGDQPCSQCQATQRTCEYPVADKKVFVAASEYEDLRASRHILEKCLDEFLPDPTQRQAFLSQARQSAYTRRDSLRPTRDDGLQYSSSAASTSSVALSPPYETVLPQYQHATHTRKLLDTIDTGATEGSLLQDRDGTKRWLGGTSGATFLDHLKKFMHTLKSSLAYSGASTDTSPGLKFLASRGQYQTSDSQLLFTPAADHINSLSPVRDWNVAGGLLAKVDEFLQNYANAWQCGGIHYFGDFSLRGWLNIQAEEIPRREVAFYEVAFALGTIYSLTATSSRRDGQLGEMSFARARHIMGDPMDISHHNFQDVPTLAMMAIYMTEMNRRDNAYAYLSYAITICCMFGGMKGSFNDERDRRIVWTLFCLSKDLSCLMGRPPLIPDEAFQLPLPEVTPGLPPPFGLIAHIDLSKIAGYIVSNTYSIAPRESIERFQDPCAQVAKPLQMLEEWRERLSPDLQIPLKVPPEFPILTKDLPLDLRKSLEEQIEETSLPIDRALCTLHMKWNQLLILTLRPLFFLAVKSSIGGDLINAPRDMLEHPGIEPDYILQCSAAARRNLRLGRHIYERCGLSYEEPAKLVMLDLHHIFNAAVVLLLHQMVFSNVVNTDTMALRAARQILETEARAECGPPGNDMGGGVGASTATGYASDCVGVLKDLAALVARIRPLRFKGSDHVNAGVDMVWGIPISADIGGGRGDGGCSTDAMGAPIMLSEEQLAANLSLENPFGLDGMYNPIMMQGPLPQQSPCHTNQKELERWVQEGLWGLSVPLGGYTGM